MVDSAPPQRIRLVLALLGLLTASALLVTALRPGTSPVAVPRAIATPGDSSFRGAFRPFLDRATAQARELVTMGDARERNLLRLRAGQDAMNAALDEADAWLAAHPPPVSDAAAIDAYRDGAKHIRTAMAEAQAGFLRLDFARVAAATVTMRSGLAALERASAALGP
jgi:hypothetical protein